MYDVAFCPEIKFFYIFYSPIDFFILPLNATLKNIKKYKIYISNKR